MTVIKNKKDYANKVLTLDPLSDRLNAVGFTGGASKRYLNSLKNTQKLLKKVEKDIKSDFRKTDQGKKNTKEDSEFRKFLREQKARRTISTDFS